MFLTERTLGAKVLSHNGFGNLREVNRIEGVGVRERSGDGKGEVRVHQVRLVGLSEMGCPGSGLRAGSDLN